MFSVLVIRLRSLRLLRVSGIVMRLRMFLLLITFLKASHSFRNRLLVIRSEERFSRNAETDLVCRLLLEKKKSRHLVCCRATHSYFAVPGFTHGTDRLLCASGARRYFT